MELDFFAEDLGLKHVERIRDGFIHVPVAVCAKAAAKDEVGYLCGFFSVLGVHLVVAGVVHRVIRFVALLVGLGVFTADDRLSGSERYGAFGVVMLELVGAGVRNFHVGIVHHGRALIVLHVHGFPLEAERTPFQLTVLVVEELIGHTGVDDRRVGRDGVLDVGVFGVQLHSDERIIEHALEDAEVAVLGHALPYVVEIVGIVGGAEGQTADDGRRQFLGVVFPLLVGVALDEGLIERTPDERDGLFFEVLRISDEVVFDLGLEEGFGLSGAEVLAVEGVDGAEVDGHGVDLALIVDEHLMLIAGELAELRDVLPHLRQRSVEDMRTVAMALDARFLVDEGMAVAADVIASVDDRNGLLHDRSDTLGNSRPPETCAYDVVLHDYPSKGNFNKEPSR